jgi:hypothetical protein
LVGVDVLDYECDRFISKQCDSYAMHVLCYLYCIILYTCYILYTILYYVLKTIIWQQSRNRVFSKIKKKYP